MDFPTTYAVSPPSTDTARAASNAKDSALALQNMLKTQPSEVAAYACEQERLAMAADDAAKTAAKERKAKQTTGGARTMLRNLCAGLRKPEEARAGQSNSDTATKHQPAER